jgi:alpha/beta superfamily hydrolase
MELVGRFNFDYFVGHKITNARTKRSGIILSQKNTKDLKIKPSNLLKPGDKAYVWVAKTGDSVSIPSWVNVKKVGNGYEVKANSPLQLMTSDGSKHFIDSKELAKKTVNIKMK